jgi:hypothetical protein
MQESTERLHVLSAPILVSRKENLMPRIFEIVVGPHAPQLAIQAHDLTLNELRLLNGIIANSMIDSEDYINCRPANPFMQGFAEPYGKGHDGWGLVEFWCSNDRARIETCVRYINKRFAEEETRYLKESLDYSKDD